MKNIIIIVLFILLGAGAYYAYITLQDTEPLVDIALTAQSYCSQENVAQVEVSRSAGFIKVTSALLGGGSTYYGETDMAPLQTPLQCPVVAPDSMSDDCKAILAVTDWVLICENTITPPVVTPTDEEAELTGFNFILDSIAVAATTSSSTSTEDRVLGALSLNAQNSVSRETLSQDLAAFLGIQDVPDQGASVEDLQIISDTEAQLFIGLNYSGGRTLRTVHLVVENDAWKVDSVSSTPISTADFEREGNLTMHSDGTEPNTWTLVYEEPGQPALTKQLTFDTASICATGVENSTCDSSTFTPGQRVKILGTSVDEENVLVIRLENI
jgi:hypothetical protein